MDKSGFEMSILEAIRIRHSEVDWGRDYLLLGRNRGAGMSVMMESTVAKAWQEALGPASIAEMNRLIKPAVEARERGDAEPAKLLAAEAKRRGYVFQDGAYKDVPPMVITKGRNLLRVGWRDGVLYATFTSGPKVYEYPGVPHEEYFKLTRSPFPDKLFFTNIKGKFEAAK